MAAQPLTQKVARAAREVWGCFFHGGAFGIEGMIHEKMISISFGEAVDHEERAPDATYARTLGARATQPLHGQTRAPPGAWV